MALHHITHVAGARIAQDRRAGRHRARQTKQPLDGGHRLRQVFAVGAGKL